jgi:hypothetical protein
VHAAAPGFFLDRSPQLIIGGACLLHADLIRVYVVA